MRWKPPDYTHLDELLDTRSADVVRSFTIQMSISEACTFRNAHFGRTWQSPSLHWSCSPLIPVSLALFTLLDPFRSVFQYCFPLTHVTPVHFARNSLESVWQVFSQAVHFVELDYPLQSPRELRSCRNSAHPSTGVLLLVSVPSTPWTHNAAYRSVSM